MSDQQPKLSPEFLRLLESVKGKRSRVVIDHILKHGHITTEELEITYGYKHPPRAIRDVREQGIPIETFRVKNKQGRSIAAYRFGEFSDVIQGRIGGRGIFPKSLKDSLISKANSKCAICNHQYEDRYLQIDHRIPYEVASEIENMTDTSAYMILCASCNRAKSWSCEHCDNWRGFKKPEICTTCYWVNPPKYEHIAMQQIRRVDLVWSDPEIAEYEELLRHARGKDMSLSDYIKSILKNDAHD